MACNGVAAVLLCKTGGSKQGESGRESISERSDGPLGHSERTVDVSIPSHLLPAVRRGVRRIPPLMKSDILEMTGAMTALCQDTVEREGNVNSYKLPHLCTPAPLFQGECVMEVLVISKSTGDTSFSSGSAEVYSQQNNDRCDDSRTSE